MNALPPSIVQPVNGLLLHGPLQLAKAVITCWKCKNPTEVFAIIAADQEGFDDGVSTGREEAEAFIYGIAEDEMPDTLVQALADLAPNYKPIYSNTMACKEWANGCEHCGSLQGTFFQHMEPDGPFFSYPSEFYGQRVPLLAISVVIDYQD